MSADMTRTPDDPIYTLAHLSDVHLGPLVGLKAWHLSKKRTLGALNWALNRSKGHRPETANAVMAAVHAATPDHIAVTGDLTNLGLAAEAEQALVWLKRLGTPEDVTVIPGNHDLYVPEDMPAALKAWAPYMTSRTGDVTHAQLHEPFPFVRRLVQPSDGLRGVALIGVNSAAPRPPFNASGAIGRAQREALAAHLTLLGEDFIRVVLIHHPPLPGLGSRRSPDAQSADEMALSDQKRGLNDALEFAALLKMYGAELVLHGHNHRDMRNETAGPDGPIPIIGARSASLAMPHKGEDGAGFTLITLGRRSGGPIDVKVVPVGATV
jgi:3',5'-cyclic AMP phosphodiesterase CpdA